MGNKKNYPKLSSNTPYYLELYGTIPLWCNIYPEAIDNNRATVRTKKRHFCFLLRRNIPLEMSLKALNAGKAKRNKSDST